MFVKLPLVLLVFCVSTLSLPIWRREPDECGPLHLVHLAGTIESGFGIVGEPLAAALNSTIPGTTSYAVVYNTFPEYYLTVSSGVQLTEEYLKLQTAKCPDQRFVLSGYSKGAWVLHSLNLSEDIKSKVMSVLVFGDPLRNISDSWPITSPSVNPNPRNETLPSQNVASFCNDQDLICTHSGFGLASHLQYPNDGSVNIAVDFVKAILQDARLGQNSSTNSTLDSTPVSISASVSSSSSVPSPTLPSVLTSTLDSAVSPVPTSNSASV